MWSIIRQNFSPGRIGFWAPRDFQGLFQCPDPDNLDALSGHLYYGIDGVFSDDRPLFKWTILRDPVERVVSQILYNKRELGLSLSTKQYLLAPVTAPLASNVMVRMIGSALTTRQVDKAIRTPPSTIDPSIGTFLHASAMKEDPFDCFQRAIARLSSMHFGIKEYLEASAASLSAETGMQVPVQDNEGHNKYRDALQQSEIDLIEHHNKYDILLYREMKREFENRYSQFI